MTRNVLLALALTLGCAALSSPAAHACGSAPYAPPEGSAEHDGSAGEREIEGAVSVHAHHWLGAPWSVVVYDLQTLPHGPATLALSYRRGRETVMGSVELVRRDGARRVARLGPTRGAGQ